MTLCDDCCHLEIWPKVVGGSRYLCGKRMFDNPPKEFGKFGSDTAKGIPPVKKCSEYKQGLHYSRKKK